MNAYIVAIFCLVATVSGGHLGYGAVNAGYYAPNPAAHIPSGSVSVSHDGAVLAGPAGSVRTDNGLGGHGAATVVDGPAGKIATQGGHTVLTGPGNGHDDGAYNGGYDGGYDGGYNGGYVAGPVYAAAPAVYAAPVHAAPGVGAWGPAAGLIGGGWGHGGHVAGVVGYGGYGHHGW